MGHSLEATERTFAEALEANGGGAFESLRQRRATLLNTLLGESRTQMSTVTPQTAPRAVVYSRVSTDAQERDGPPWFRLPAMLAEPEPRPAHAAR